MNEFARRLIRRSLAVAVVLAIVGVIFAEIFLALQRMNSGTAAANANEAVRWRTPLTMAGIGVVLHVMFELLGFALRRKRRVAVLEPSNPTEQSGPSAS